MNNNSKVDAIKYCLRFLPDKTYINLYYFLKFKHFCNFKNPQTFNEKIQWLKLNDRKPAYCKLVDKYEVREYIKNKMGEEYLIPLIGVYDKFDDIDFDSLPNQFVIKATHDSGSVVICKDKKNFDIKSARNIIEKSLKRNFYYIAREWIYKNVTPRIIIEQYMVDDSGVELKDYKFFCFNGKVKCLKIDFDRFTEHKANYYNEKFELLKFGEVKCPPDFNKKMKKPNNFDKMIEIAEKLSEDIPFLRVDLYEIDNKVYFGELTFFPASGFGRFEPKEYDIILGNWLDLKHKGTVSKIDYNKKEELKKGTGLKDKSLFWLDKFYVSIYKSITKFTYWIKQNRNKTKHVKINKEYKKKIKKFWKQYGVRVKVEEFGFYDSKNKKKEVKYITKKIFHSNIEPFYNDILLSKAFSDKNYLDLYLSNAHLPETVIRNIAGTVLNSKYEAITEEQAIEIILEQKNDIVIKPSIDSGGGRKVEFIAFDDNQKLQKLQEYINKNNKNYVIQKVLKQHKLFSEFNGTSVNTVRVCSFLHNGKVEILYSVLRVGKEGSKVDNASAGGYEVVLNRNGYFTDIVNITNKVVNSSEIKYDFKNKKLPFYEKIIEEVKKLHPRLAHFKLVGWDVTVDEFENPVVIEVNIKDIGMSDKSQPVNGALFGKLTEEVLKEVFGKNKV